MDKSIKEKSHSRHNYLKEQKITEKQSSFEPQEKQKKSRKRKPDSEKDKQKAEYERSGNELKKLIEQFGSKAKVAEEIEKDTSTLRCKIFELMAKAKSKSHNNMKTRQDAAPHHQTTTSANTTFNISSLFVIIWNNLMSLITLIVHPIQALYQSYEKLYCGNYGINWSLFLTAILLLEITIIGLIWKIRRIHYISMYEPYEAVVHGTFGVETTFWTYLSSIIDMAFDFISEIRQGGRSFSSSNYDGLVPI